MIRTLAYNALWPAITLALAACTYTLADHERDGYVRSFAEERGVAPIQFTWRFDGGANTGTRRIQPGRWEIQQPPRCRPDAEGWAPVDCQRSAVAHVEAAYWREGGEPRCVTELRKHQQLGMVPDLAALGCTHTGEQM